jgi:hypothetical protein
MTSPQTLAHYLTDVVTLLLEEARAAKSDARRDNTEFARGRAFAHYAVVSLLCQQAKAFGIPPEDLGLTGVDPEADFLGD